MSKALTHLVWLFLLCLVYFSAFLGGYDLWPPDEPRFAEVAREMMDSEDYLVPRTNGVPYKEKPPLMAWAIVACSLPGGEVTALSTRLPLLFAGVITILLTYLLAWRLYGCRIAWWSALMLATTQRIWWQCHTGQIDMLLCACLSLALLAYVLWKEEQRYPYLALFYLACTAALYAKGPGVLVYPGLFLLSYEWSSIWRCRKDLAALRHSPVPHMVIGFALVVLVYALWLVPSRMAAAAALENSASDAIAGNLFRQTIGRFLLGVSHANPPWYYLETLPVDWLPWTLFLPWVLLWSWRHRKDDDGMRLLMCWIAPAFIFFSISIGKRGVYLLPIFPACAIFFARSILDLMESDHHLYARRTAYLWAGVLLFLGSAPWLLLITPFKDQWTPALIALSVVSWGCVLSTACFAFKGESRQLHSLIVVHFILVTVAAAFTALPIVNQHKSARPFCAPVRQLSEAGESFDLYSAGFIREEYIFYSRHFIQEYLTDLLEIPAMQDWSLREKAELQKKLRRRLTKAVASVPLADLKAISPIEQRALVEAATEHVELEETERVLLPDFEDALRAAVSDLFAIFQQDSPAFLYIQEEDWRWMAALSPEVLEMAVIHDYPVGSRHVLLVANAPGEALLQAQH